MPGSVRNYAIQWIGATKGAGGGAAMGGNALLATPQHKLDGIEHLTADDTTRLDATTVGHGLMPKLSGDVDDVFHGDGTQAPLDHGALGGLADDDHPQYTTDAEVTALIAATAARQPVVEDDGAGSFALVFETNGEVIWE